MRPWTLVSPGWKTQSGTDTESGREGEEAVDHLP